MAKTALLSLFLVHSLITVSLHASPKGKKVALISSDGEVFDVDEDVALESGRIRAMINGSDGHVGIPLPGVEGEILARVIEYSEKHARLREIRGNVSYYGGEIKRWDENFIMVDNCTLFRLVQASQYLGMEGLTKLARGAMFDRVFRPVMPLLNKIGPSCWSVYGCIPSGGWLIVPDSPLPVGTGTSQDEGKEEASA